MVALLTLEAAKRNLRVDHDDDDADITRKIAQASAIVLDYIKRPDAVWTPDDVPMEVAAAVELMLGDLYDDRSAGPASNDVARGYLPVKITALLHRWRDPAIA